MEAKSSTPISNRPEKKFGPFPGGFSVVVWKNTIDTANGKRKTRTISISPRRFKDPKTNEWKDSASYRDTDLPVLLYALEQAQEFLITNPLRGSDKDE